MDLGTLDIRALSLTRKKRPVPLLPIRKVKTVEMPNQSYSLESPTRYKIPSKDSPRSSLNSLNKLKSQKKKPSQRNGSPLNWIPRKKGDTYLKRKFSSCSNLLQEGSQWNEFHS